MPSSDLCEQFTNLAISTPATSAQGSTQAGHDDTPAKIDHGKTEASEPLDQAVSSPGNEIGDANGNNGGTHTRGYTHAGHSSVQCDAITKKGHRCMKWTKDPVNCRCHYHIIPEGVLDDLKGGQNSEKGDKRGEGEAEGEHGDGTGV
jgi:hypothetical protein